MKSFKPLIIAHRGASALAPENTLAAFGKAIDAGADGIELDVRLAKDGVPVVFHDSTLARLAKIEGQIADFTSEELNRIDVGSWFNQAFPKLADQHFSKETIINLSRLLDFLADYKGLIYIELKGNDSIVPAFTAEVCELIRHNALLPQIIVKSFKLEALKLVKEILPEARTAALFEPKILTILRRKKLILDEARRVAADEISIHYSLATKNFVRLIRENNFSTVVWTVDRPIWVRRAADYAIDAVITNNPARLLAERDKRI